MNRNAIMMPFVKYAQNAIMMPFVKYAQTHLNILIHDEKKKIKGVFKNKKTGKIVKGDNFLAVVCGRRTAEETYKAYLNWYNHTREDYEKEAEREFVSAKWDEAEAQRQTISLSESEVINAI